MSNFIWQFDTQSLYTDAKAQRYLRLMTETADNVQPPLEASERDSGTETFCVIASYTGGVSFAEGARPKDETRRWIKQLNRIHEMTGDELWTFYRGLPYKIRNEWYQAAVDSQELFDIPIEQRSLATLTPEQQAEAAVPGSPLPVSG